MSMFNGARVYELKNGELMIEKAGYRTVTISFGEIPQGLLLEQVITQYENRLAALNSALKKFQ